MKLFLFVVLILLMVNSVESQKKKKGKNKGKGKKDKGEEKAAPIIMTSCEYRGEEVEIGKTFQTSVTDSCEFYQCVQTEDGSAYLEKTQVPIDGSRHEVFYLEPLSGSNCKSCTCQVVINNKYLSCIGFGDACRDPINGNGDDK